MQPLRGGLPIKCFGPIHEKRESEGLPFRSANAGRDLQRMRIMCNRLPRRMYHGLPN